MTWEVRPGSEMPVWHEEEDTLGTSASAQTDVLTPQAEEPTPHEWSGFLSCGCTIGQAASGRHWWRSDTPCTFADLHHAWSIGVTSPPLAWWQRGYGWTPTRFEVACMGLGAAFCATYGPLSVWGWVGSLAVTLVAIALVAFFVETKSAPDATTAAQERRLLDRVTEMCPRDSGYLVRSVGRP